MTDRSSEERSRFEKWAFSVGICCLDVTSWDPTRYAAMETHAAWRAWVAALEDRQEAAVEVLPVCEICGDSEYWHSRNLLGNHADGHKFKASGVPSEATPSKENEMVGSTGRIHKKTHDCETAGCRPAPAPEVQGTPTKSNVAHQPWCASAPRPMDVPMGRGPYPCDCGTVKAAPAPVGTPQKETPTMPYGAGAQNFGVKTYAETADQIRAATFVGTDKFVQTDTQQLPAPVPEVQGTPTKKSEPKFTNRHGKPCSQACYEGRHAECTETFVTCNCTCRSWHVTQHAYQNFASVPVGTPQKETPPMISCCEYHKDGGKTDIRCIPEGVQGKEPQTFEEWWVRGGRSAWFAAPHAEEIAKVAFRAGEVSGEAAGRRSAITPEQVEKMREGCHATYNGGHHDAIPYEAFHHGMDTVFNVLKARAERECAELQEKTK